MIEHWSYNNVPEPQITNRGFTGHEHLDEFNLIDMNGRMYDPVTAGFLSPDPFVADPFSSQSFNGYSYCVNNPLRYTDPTGYLVAEIYDQSHPYPDVDYLRLFTRSRALGFYGTYSEFVSSYDDLYHKYATDPLFYNSYNEGGRSVQLSWYSQMNVYDPVTETIEGYIPIRGIISIGITKHINVSARLLFGNTNNASDGGDGYRYGRPESVALWLVSALGAIISETNVALRNSELNSRIIQLIPFSLDYNTGKLSWVNPKFAKYAKWAGIAGWGGDILNIAGVLNNVYIRGEGWTNQNKLDATFGLAGIYPIYGDAIAFMYMVTPGMDRLLKEDSGFFIQHSRNVHNFKCFVGGSQVTMADGTLKNIESVQIGDSVLTYNFINQKFEKNRVLHVDTPVHHKLIKVEFTNREEIISTEDHPYYVKGKGWCSFNPQQTQQNLNMQTGQLEVADYCFAIRRNKLKKVEILQIEPLEESVKTYNLSIIENSDNYFVNGILVNNESKLKH